MKFLSESLVGVPKKYRPKSEVYILEGDKIYVAKTDEGFYTLPGGGIENNETPEQAAVRECKEEVGVKIVNLKPIGKNPLCFPFDKHNDFKGNYDGMCTYSFTAEPDKVGKGIEKHLKLEIIEISKLIDIYKKARKDVKTKWGKIVIEHRIEMLESLGA